MDNIRNTDDMKRSSGVVTDAHVSISRFGHLLQVIKQLGDQVRKAPDQFFFALLCIYIVSNLMYMIGWKNFLSDAIWNTHVILFSCVMWGSAIYLFSIIVEWREAWKKTLSVIMIGVVVFLVTAVLSRIMTTDSYAYIMGTFFILIVCGKNYRKILYWFLSLLVAALVIGVIGLQFGITFDAAKPRRAYGGHSLGILYPNNWGFLVFAALVIVWYLWLRNRKLFTVVLFWGTAAFMYKYITCVTIAGLAFAFPVIAVPAELLQEWQKDGIQSEISNGNGILRALVIFIPFLVFGIMMFLCWQMDWIHETFYETALESAAMRFVEGGYALRLNGISLLGHPFEQMDTSISGYNADIEMIIDSAYTSYLIIRGLIWMLVILSWLAYAHYLCMKRRDYRLIVISTFFLIFSMMERPGLDVWYNFVLLYPLADSSRCFIKQVGIAE